MTERTRGSQLTGSHPEAIDLNELHASKSMDPSSANTDLANASIQSISVVRLSSRPERRKIASPTLSQNEEPMMAPDRKAPTTSRPHKGINFGVLKNPYYKYEGNVVERFISLVANLLKVIEHSLLRSFKPKNPPPPPPTVVVKPKRRGPDGREIEDEKEVTPKRPSDPLEPIRE